MRSEQECRMGGPRFWAEASTPLKAVLVLGGVAALVGLMGLVGWLFMCLWNALMPSIFRLPEIGYWQGWGLLVLSSMLFKRGGPDHRVGGEFRKRRLRERMREAAEGLRGASDGLRGGEEGEGSPASPAD